jgi:DNA-binding protein
MTEKSSTESPNQLKPNEESNHNIVYIGRKPVMSYVLAVLTSLKANDVNEVLLKARGRAITTAVDVAEVTRRKFVNNLQIGKITIGTEQMPQVNGTPRNVSTMEIALSLAS